MFVESVNLWEKTTCGNKKQQELYNSDKNNGCHGNKKYMQLLTYNMNHFDGGITAVRQSNFQFYIR